MSPITPGDGLKFVVGGESRILMLIMPLNGSVTLRSSPFLMLYAALCHTFE
jgi:hypothetical protein